MKTRVLSAIVMILIAVPLLIMGGELFAIFMTVLAMLGLYELIHIAYRLIRIIIHRCILLKSWLCL